MLGLAPRRVCSVSPRRCSLHSNFSKFPRRGPVLSLLFLVRRLCARPEGSLISLLFNTEDLSSLFVSVFWSLASRLILLVQCSGTHSTQWARFSFQMLGIWKPSLPPRSPPGEIPTFVLNNRCHRGSKSPARAQVSPRILTSQGGEALPETQTWQKELGWVWKWKWKSLSHVWLFATPWT